MATDTTELDIAKLDVLEGMREVLARAETARRAIVNDTGIAWVWRDPDIDRPTSEYDRDYAAWATIETDYVSDRMITQDTLCAPGVVAVSKTTREALDALNAAKEAFRGICAELKTLKIRIDGRHERLVSHWLRQNGFGRINRRQVYRHARVLDKRPEKISFSWVAPVRTEKLDLEKAFHYVQTRARDDDDIAAYIDRLAETGEKHFAVVTEPKRAQPRANVWYPRADNPKLIPAATPLFIPNETQPPAIKRIDPVRAAPDRERTWRHIDPAAIIPELNLHRYQHD